MCVVVVVALSESGRLQAAASARRPKYRFRWSGCSLSRLTGALYSITVEAADEEAELLEKERRPLMTHFFSLVHLVPKVLRSV